MSLISGKFGKLNRSSSGASYKLNGMNGDIIIWKINFKKKTAKLFVSKKDIIDAMFTPISKSIVPAISLYHGAITLKGVKLE